MIRPSPCRTRQLALACGPLPGLALLHPRENRRDWCSSRRRVGGYWQITGTGVRLLRAMDRAAQTGAGFLLATPRASKKEATRWSRLKFGDLPRLSGTDHVPRQRSSGTLVARSLLDVGALDLPVQEEVAQCGSIEDFQVVLRRDEPKRQAAIGMRASSAYDAAALSELTQ
jgi:hypothetical protein